MQMTVFGSWSIWKKHCGPWQILSVVVLEESACPRGSSMINFQVLVLESLVLDNNTATTTCLIFGWFKAKKQVKQHDFSTSFSFVLSSLYVDKTVYAWVSFFRFGILSTRARLLLRLHDHSRSYTANKRHSHSYTGGGELSEGQISAQ